MCWLLHSQRTVTSTCCCSRSGVYSKECTSYNALRGVHLEECTAGCAYRKCATGGHLGESWCAYREWVSGVHLGNAHLRSAHREWISGSAHMVVHRECTSVNAYGCAYRGTHMLSCKHARRWVLNRAWPRQQRGVIMWQVSRTPQHEAHWRITPTNVYIAAQ